MPLLTLRNIHMAYGGPALLDGINLQIDEGDRLCLLGRNGCGKSTLLKLIHGDLVSDGGEFIRHQNIRTALVTQDVPPGMSGSVAEIVADFPHDHDHHEESWKREQRATQVMRHLLLNPEADFCDLSGGTKRRVLLARALASAPDILLLDEPTNHLDITTILWLEEHLLRHGGACLFVTHDRAFARRLATRVAEIDRGRIYAFSCGYDEFVLRREDLLEAEVKRQALFDKKLAQEEAWIRQGIKARRTRNEGRVRALKALRDEYRSRRNRQGTVKLALQEGERSGHLVIEATGVSFAYGDSPIITHCDTTIIRGDKIGIIGPNGAGKTTLIKLLLGELQPTAGTIRQGTRQEILYMDQMRDQLDDTKSVAENVGEGNDSVIINGVSRHVIGYLQDFLFEPERARSPISILSGGERNRLLLAKLFTKPANVLIMDEPTNDLDSETLELLESLLVEYQGTLLLVSHDREFINNVVTSTLSITPTGYVEESAGGYDDWVDQQVRTNQDQGKTAPSSERERPQRQRPVKLSYKEQQELLTLPETIHELEMELQVLHNQLADPVFYKEAGSLVTQATGRLHELEQEIAEAFERWEELESRRDTTV